MSTLGPADGGGRSAGEEERYPAGITKRHLDVAPRSWGRWAAVVCLAALPILALLNVFGQHPSTTSANSPYAALTVTAPTRLRGGLQFQVKVTVAAHSNISHLALAFSPGWFESMGVNSIEPQPSTQTFVDGRVVLQMGSLNDGQSLTTWLNFNVNPTNVGTRTEDLAVMNGPQDLVAVHRSLTVFP